LEADDGTRGWRALIGEEDEGSLMVVTFCPECAERSSPIAQFKNAVEIAATTSQAMNPKPTRAAMIQSHSV
jgi:hypothetical protein